MSAAAEKYDFDRKLHNKLHKYMYGFLYLHFVHTTSAEDCLLSLLIRLLKSTLKIHRHVSPQLYRIFGAGYV